MKTSAYSFLVLALICFGIGISLLIAGLVIASFSNHEPNRILMIASSGIAFLAAFSIWIYWIRFFLREGHSKRLVLCFALPYVYALYIAFRLLIGHKKIEGQPS